MSKCLKSSLFPVKTYKAACVSCVSHSSGSKVLLHMTDREKYVCTTTHKNVFIYYVVFFMISDFLFYLTVVNAHVISLQLHLTDILGYFACSQSLSDVYVCVCVEGKLPCTKQPQRSSRLCAGYWWRPERRLRRPTFR